MSRSSAPAAPWRLVAAFFAAGQLLLHVDAASATRGFDPDPVEEITYYNQVSRILQENCVACHRQGGIAPFALESYEQVAGLERVIGHAVAQGKMPPWFANPEYGAFANDRSLDPAARDVLLKWIESGSPAGDPADAPEPVTFVEGWNIGEPHLVLQLPDAVHIPASGEVPYMNVVVPARFAEDRWVEAVEIRPTALSVTHHILATLRVPDPDNPGRSLRVGPGGVEGYFALMVPGSTGIYFGEGRAKRLPAGSDLVFQLHYTANGHEAHDQAQIGFVFSDGPPREQVETASAANIFFRIPAGAERHEVRGEFRFPEDGKVLSFMPHTHVRGVAFRYELIRADGSSEIVLDLPNYDFNWQLDYILAQPLRVAAGDVMRATAWYDNSANNPSNPDPTVDVRFGEQTWEEMMIGYFDWVPSSGVAASEAAAAR